MPACCYWITLSVVQLDIKSDDSGKDIICLAVLTFFSFLRRTLLILSRKQEIQEMNSKKNVLALSFPQRLCSLATDEKYQMRK